VPSGPNSLAIFKASGYKVDLRETKMILLTMLFWLASAAPRMIPIEDASLIGKTAPDIALEVSNGEQFSIGAHRGKPVILAFWASWCSPCRYELPALDKWVQDGAPVHLAAINVDRKQFAAKRFLSKIKFSQPIVWDPMAKAMGSYQIMSMPTIVLIDKEGTVRWVKVGYSREKGLTELKAQVDGLQ